MLKKHMWYDDGIDWISKPVKGKKAKKCVYCGANITRDDSWCHYCGTRIVCEDEMRYEDG